MHRWERSLKGLPLSEKIPDASSQISSFSFDLGKFRRASDPMLLKVPHAMGIKLGTGWSTARGQGRPPATPRRKDASSSESSRSISEA
jgi:hypothetical protein